MKKLANLVQVVENNKECVILEVTGTAIELIKLGCFNGDETMMRLTKGDNHTCTVWTKDTHYSWHWGPSGTTIVSDAMRKRGRLIQECIEQDFEIYIGTNPKRIAQTLHIKSLEDVKHTSHTIKMMYWSNDKANVCCHFDGEYHTHFKGVECGINHFVNKGYEIMRTDCYTADTGCIVEVYEITR